MTFEEFKALCKAKKNANIKLPETNQDYKPLIQESLEYVAKNCIPIDLVTNDPMKETLRWIDGKNLIKKPIAPIDEKDLIDIDEQLTYAVAYDLLANKTADLTKASFYIQKRDEEVSTYKWNNYKFLQQIGVCE